ncbi:Condensin-2 complex subunit D3 [Strongyloides ratti]|uniref:Condensin-2 complex subunit D3 n=1 Tax=Strongyloides ratti TaxID=34506 RepID=A0A090L3J7_STRRB|nr:Condensin-2 complex subunit D3 [Strongyloides ratti]CEF64381.1 Condensin-2 complex subunit D3 [Strongyloides ratti]
MDLLLEFLNNELSFIHEIPHEIASNFFDELCFAFNFAGITDDLHFFYKDQSIIKLSELSSIISDKVLHLCRKDEVILNADEILLEKKLCILLCYGINYALKNKNTFKALKNGLLSTRCYLLLASINGNVKYNIYQENIVRECLNIYIKVLNIIITKFSEIKNKSNKSRKNMNITNDYSNNNIDFSKEEFVELEKELRISLDGLFFLIEKESLVNSEDNLQLVCNIINNLFKIDISRDTNIYMCGNINEFRSITNFSHIGFSLLHYLCHLHHNALEVLYPAIIMPRIMYASIVNNQFLPSNCHINMEMTNICETFIKFLKERIKINEAEQEVIYCMLISSCLKCPERAEYRTKIIKSVIDVVSYMSLDYKKRFVDDILIIGQNIRGGLRSFAIEAIPLIYTNFDFIELGSQTTINNNINFSQDIIIKKEVNSSFTEITSQESLIEYENLELKFLKLVVYGIEDKLSCVRQRALSVIPIFLKNKILINQCNNLFVDLFKELHKIELKKYNNRRKDYQSSVVDKKRKKFQKPTENNNNNDTNGENNNSSNEIIELSNFQSNNEEVNNINDTSDNLQNDTNEYNMVMSPNINSMGIDMNSTQINVQIISDVDGIFERKRVFKVHDYPLLNRLLVRCDDYFAACRKSAIIALEQLFHFLTKPNHIDAVISQFCRLARSKSVSIRKQIAETIYNILFCLDENDISFKKLIFASMECIFLQVTDREISVQLNAAKLVKHMIFLPLINMNIKDKLAWNILSISEENLTYQKILKQTIPFLVKEKLIDGDLIKSLDGLIEDLQDENHRQNIWMLYSILSIFFNVDPNNASKEFLKIENYHIENDTRLCNYLTNIISNGAKKLLDVTRKKLIDKIENYISLFSINNSNVSSLYYCYGVLLYGVGDCSEEGKTLFAQKNKDIFAEAQKNMKLLMFEKYHDDANASNFSTSLYLPNDIEKEREDIKLAMIIGIIGEIIDYEQSLINKDLFEMIQIIMSSKTCIKALRIFQEQTLNGTILSSTCRQNTQMSQFSQRNHIKPLSIMETFKTHHIKYANITSIVRAHCIILMGKICLVNEIFAKDVIPVFMKELVICKDYIIRNNIIIVTHDLCKRHTSLVGSYLNIFGACLSDDSVAVRIHTLHCLTKLLKEKYLLWKGGIMFRFVCTLLDKVEKVRDYAEFCLIETLLPVTPDMFFSNFIDCIYYFNGVEHPSWIVHNQVKDETSLGIFYKHRSLQGNYYQDDRLKLYRFMLKNMTTIQKAAITQKICIEIFEKISHNLLDLFDINVQNLLMDSFKLLSSEEGKIRFNVRKDGEEEDYNEESELRREFITMAAEKVSKKALEEIFIREIMKYLLELKDTLYNSRNSVCSLGFLKYLLHLSNEYNYEFNKIIDENKHLAANVRHDILRFKNKLSQENNI